MSLYGVGFLRKSSTYDTVRLRFSSSSALSKAISYKRLDIAREKYEEILRPLLLNKVHIDYDTCYVNKKSVEWKAVEDVLFHAMAKGHATSEDITGIFERLGYIDTYIKDIVSGNRYNRALASEKLGGV